MTVVAKKLAAVAVVLAFLVDVAVAVTVVDAAAKRRVLDCCCCLAVADDWLKMVVRILRLLLLPKPLVLS